jgi:hypothetical protein
MDTAPLVPMTPAEVAADLASRLASGRGSPAEATQALADIGRQLRGEPPPADPKDAARPVRGLTILPVMPLGAIV